MYNGGVTTPRDSGSNGHIPANWACVKNLSPTNKSEELGQSAAKTQGISDHDIKRKIELKCEQFADLLETQSVTETHQLSSIQKEKSARLREALELSEYYAKGRSFDPLRQGKESSIDGDTVRELQEFLERKNKVAEPCGYDSPRTPTPKDCRAYKEKIVKKKKKKYKNKRSKSKSRRKKKKHKSESSEESDASLESADKRRKRSRKKAKKKASRRDRSSSKSCMDSSPPPKKSKSSKNHNSGSSKSKRKNSEERKSSKKNRYKSKERHRSNRSDESRKSTDIDRSSSRSLSRDNFKHKSRKSRSTTPKNNRKIKKDESKDRKTKRESLSIPEEIKRNRKSLSRSQSRDRKREVKYEKNKSPIESLRKSRTIRKTHSRSKSRSDKSTSRSTSKSNSRCRNISRSRSRSRNRKHRSDEKYKLKIKEQKQILKRDSNSLEKGYDEPKNGKKTKLDKSETICIRKSRSPCATKVCLNTLKPNDSYELPKGDLKSFSPSPQDSKSIKSENHFEEVKFSESRSSFKEKSPGLSTNIERKRSSSPKISSPSKKRKLSPIQKKSRSRSPEEKHIKRQNNYLKLEKPKPVVKLRASSSEGDQSGYSSKEEEVEDKDINMLKMLKSGLAAKAKSTLEKKKTAPQTPVKQIQHDIFDIKMLPLLIQPKAVKISKDELDTRRTLENIRARSNSCDSKQSYSRCRSRSSSGSCLSLSCRRTSLSRSKSKSRSHSSRSKSRTISRDRSLSTSSRSSLASSVSSRRSRSISIPRRRGSPSFLSRRRITSARKRPIPYTRASSYSSVSSHSDSDSSYHLRHRSSSRSPSPRRSLSEDETSDKSLGCIESKPVSRSPSLDRGFQSP